MQGDDIGPGVQIVQGGVRNAGFFRKALVRVQVIGQDVHPEAFENADEDSGDFSRSDDAGRFSIHVKAHQAVKRKIAVPGAPVGAVYFAVQGKHQGYGMFRHRIGRILGHPHDGQFRFFRSFQIHIIESGATQSQQFDAIFLQVPYYFPVCRVIDENARYVRTAGQGHAVRSEVPFEVTDVVMEFAFIDRIEGIPVVGLGVKERNAAGMGGHRKG